MSYRACRYLILALAAMIGVAYVNARLNSVTDKVVMVDGELIFSLSYILFEFSILISILIWIIYSTIFVFKVHRMIAGVLYVMPVIGFLIAYGLTTSDWRELFEFDMNIFRKLEVKSLKMVFVGWFGVTQVWFFYEMAKASRWWKAL